MLLRLSLMMLISLLPQTALAAEPELISGASLWMAAPFALLLGAIALGPMVGHGWWGRNYPLLCFGLSALVIALYLGRPEGPHALLEAGADYISFILLIGSLFIVSSGIWIQINRPGTPMLNTALLLCGAILSNFLGTTGASMLLIRPYLSINRDRLRGYHLAFFIFIVSNIGGLLTPIGDPPLFLGYLKGIPFFWVFRQVWPIWLLALSFLLTLFFLIDSRAVSKERRSVREAEGTQRGLQIKIVGAHQFALLGIIIGAILLKSPLREGIILMAAILSYLTASRKAYQGNQFDFAPIREVAILFFGIFVTMIPALHWLSVNADRLGLSHPGDFFWGSGMLSSVLDNAPTYLNFYTVILGRDPAHSIDSVLASSGLFIQAISAGSVFFGANTYIGNGPNFMVKSVAEQAGMKTPSFMGYIIRYAIPILFPLYLAIWFLFFRGAS